MLELAVYIHFFFDHYDLSEGTERERGIGYVYQGGVRNNEERETKLFYLRQTGSQCDQSRLQDLISDRNCC